jgi:hypothetical protein
MNRKLILVGAILTAMTLEPVCWAKGGHGGVEADIGEVEAVVGTEEAVVEGDIKWEVEAVVVVVRGLVAVVVEEDTKWAEVVVENGQEAVAAVRAYRRPGLEEEEEEEEEEVVVVVVVVVVVDDHVRTRVEVAGVDFLVSEEEVVVGIDRRSLIDRRRGRVRVPVVAVATILPGSFQIARAVEVEGFREDPVVVAEAVLISRVAIRDRRVLGKAEADNNGNRETTPGRLVPGKAAEGSNGDRVIIPNRPVPVRWGW